MTSRHFTADPEAAQRKRTEALSRMEAAIEAVTTSEGFAAWLRTAAKFHNYSFGNQLLIALARPDATRVAGFRAWLELGRHVRKGSHGIPIIVPFKRKGADADDADEGDEGDADAGRSRKMGFGVGYVFDVSDTEGDELPTLGYSMIEGDTAGELWTRIQATADALGVALRIEDRAVRESANGYFNPTAGEIWIRPTLSLDGRVSVALHELAHVLDYRAHGDADDPFAYREHRGERETVAEAAAYVAADHFELDTGGATFAYVASWAQDVKILKARMGEIQRIADVLINALEGADVAAAA